MSGGPWLVAIDMQHVFGDPSSEWRAPRYAEIADNVVRLAEAFGDRSVFTRFVAPAEPRGSWVPYYEQYSWALVPADSGLYELTHEVAPLARRTVQASTFGKWTPLREVVGDTPELVVTGVATDCCVISTVLAAVDSGASVTVVRDACAGSSDEDHEKALDVMGLYAPLVKVSTTEDVLGGR